MLMRVVHFQTVPSNFQEFDATSFKCFGQQASCDTDLRAGVTIGVTTGKLKVNCRNTSRLGSFDMNEVPRPATADFNTDRIQLTSHGFSDNQAVRVYAISYPTGLASSPAYYVRNPNANDFQLSATSGGTVINFGSPGSSVYVYRINDGITQIWDTIEDLSSGPVESIPSSYAAWTNDNRCGGVEASLDDTNVWKDVTTSTCNASSCIYKDKISRLEWHRASATTSKWADALIFCNTLDYDGKSDWRLPTQKELQTAYNSGITSTAEMPNWIPLFNLNNSYWSSSSNSPNPTFAWWVNPSSGKTDIENKTVLNRVICVRP
jgi:hypothetical protein